jgi:hypothetical protein
LARVAFAEDSVTYLRVSITNAPPRLAEVDGLESRRVA